MDSFEKKEKSTEDWIFAKMQQEYKSEEDYFDELIGYIGALSKWSIFKKRPKTGAKAEYIFFNHTDEEPVSYTHLQNQTIAKRISDIGNKFTIN